MTTTVLYFLAYENFRDANTLFTLYNKVRILSFFHHFIPLTISQSVHQKMIKWLNSVIDYSQLFSEMLHHFSRFSIFLSFSWNYRHLWKLIIPIYNTILLFFPSWKVIELIPVSLIHLGPIAKNIFNIESQPNMLSMIQNLLGA